MTRGNDLMVGRYLGTPEPEKCSSESKFDSGDVPPRKTWRAARLAAARMALCRW